MRFLLVDRILRMEPGKGAIIRKNVSNSEDFFADHFAGRPIMPGCLILEACDQAARLLLGSSVGFTRFPVLERVVNGKFRHFVQPGDSLHVNVAVTSLEAASAEIHANAFVEDRSVAQISLSYRLVDSTVDAKGASACARTREFYEALTADPVSIALESRARATSQGGEAKDA